MSESDDLPAVIRRWTVGQFVLATFGAGLLAFVLLALTDAGLPI